MEEAQLIVPRVPLRHVASWPPSLSRVGATGADRKGGVMKRFAVAAVLAATAASFAFVGPLADAAGAASHPIMAGQNLPAGTVSVTNDASNVYVDISLAGWCMTESQVAVAGDSSLLPTTKKGNPQPGQFPYKTSYGDCVQSGSYTIPRASIPGLVSGSVYMAVHVDLYEATETTISAVSHPGETVYGPLSAYADYNDPAWAPFATPAVVPSFASAGVWPTLTGLLSTAQWISTASATELPSGSLITDDSWRKAEVTLTVPPGSFVSSGEVIAVTSDNAERTWLNGTPIGTDGTIVGPGTDNLEWSTISPGYTFTPVVGANTISFVWRNYGSQMGLALPQAGNPNGLVYGVSINYHTPTNHGETGWAGDFGFKGSNWATYFVYTLS